MAFDGRRASIGCVVYYLKKMFMTPHLGSQSTTDQNGKSYQLSKPEIEFNMMEKMYAALRLCTYAEKTTFLCKDD